VLWWWRWRWRASTTVEVGGRVLNEEDEEEGNVIS